MKLTNEIINKIFEKWFRDKYAEAMQARDWQTCDYLMDEKNHFEYGFKAAFWMLLPIIENLQESNSFYADEDSWTDTDNNCLSNKILDVDLEHIIGDSICGGKRARLVKKFVKDELKKIGGVDE